MRWRVPLFLALIAAVGCDEQPMEPSSDAELSQPEFAIEDGAHVYTYEMDWTVDLCGVDVVDFTGTVRDVFRTSPDIVLGTMYHFVSASNFNLTGVGRSTGWTWRAIENDNEHFHVTWEEDTWDEMPAVYTEVHKIKFIGQGRAPDFTAHDLAQYVVNANGGLVVEHYIPGFICP